MKKHFKAFVKDTEGSATIEMLYSILASIMMLVSAFLILVYVLQLDNVNFAAKQITRNIEITGIANPDKAEELFCNFLGMSYNNRTASEARNTLTNPQVKIAVQGTDGEYHEISSEKKIKLKQLFKVSATCDYKIVLIQPGDAAGYVGFAMPLGSTVTGLSEVNWK